MHAYTLLTVCDMYIIICALMGSVNKTSARSLFFSGENTKLHGVVSCGPACGPQEKEAALQIYHAR